MEIIFASDDLLRDLFMAAVSFFVVLFFIAVAGALLAGRRAQMYQWILAAGFCAFVIVMSLGLLIGNPILLLCGIGFLIILPVSYRRQKKFSAAEQEEELRQREIKRRMMIREVVDKSMEKIRSDSNLHQKESNETPD